MPWGDCSLRAATRDEVAEDECVELRLMHREHCMYLRRLACTIDKRFFFFYLPNSARVNRNFSFWLGATYSEWSFCRIFHSVRSRWRGELPLH